jgi:hypothetical protein
MSVPIVFEYIVARGHPRILATHPATFEITKDEHLTERGDCIVAVKSTKGAKDLSPKFKRLARNDSARITVILNADGRREISIGRGTSQLSFTHPSDLVVRKSGFVCGRTLMTHSNKSASDFSRSFVESLRDPNKRIEITLVVEV